MSVTLAAAMIAASTEELELGGFWFRVRKITSADIVAAGGAFLLSLPASKPVDAAELGPERASIREMLRKSPSLLADGERFTEQIAAVGVVAASQDGKTWEPFTVVLRLQDQSAPQNRVHVSALPATTVKALSSRILALSAGGVAPETLAGFLGGAAPGGVGDGAVRGG